jgi:hypothetical protein
MYEFTKMFEELSERAGMNPRSDFSISQIIACCYEFFRISMTVEEVEWIRSTLIFYEQDFESINAFIKWQIHEDIWPRDLTER